jgi:peptidoglycan-associated lipoprotein
VATATPGCKTTDECRGSNADGDVLSVCHNGECVRCVSDLDCGEGLACDEGRCEETAGVAAVAEPEIEIGESDDPLFEVAGEMGIPSICRPSDPESEQVLSLQEVLFDYDDWTLTPVGRSVLDANADCLSARPDLEIVLEGHCDERGTIEYNLALGEKRASVVREYLEHLGVPTDKLRVVSLGEDDPICWESTEACWSSNRRVEMRVSAPPAQTARAATEVIP